MAVSFILVIFRCKCLDKLIGQSWNGKFNRTLKLWYFIRNSPLLQFIVVFMSLWELCLWWVILLPCICLILPPSCNGNKCWIFVVVENIWMVFSFFYSLFSVSYLFKLLLERCFFVLFFVSFHCFLHLRIESGWFRKLRLGDHFSWCKPNYFIIFLSSHQFPTFIQHL